MKLFETFKIKKEYRKAIECIFKEIKLAQSAYWLASQVYQGANENLIKSLQELYPELKDYTFNVNYKTFEVKLTYYSKERIDRDLKVKANVRNMQTKK